MDKQVQHLNAPDVILEAVSAKKQLDKLAVECSYWHPSEYKAKLEQGENDIANFDKAFQSMLDFYDTLNPVKDNLKENSTKAKDRERTQTLRKKQMLEDTGCPPSLAKVVADYAAIAKEQGGQSSASTCSQPEYTSKRDLVGPCMFSAPDPKGAGHTTLHKGMHMLCDSLGCDPVKSQIEKAVSTIAKKEVTEASAVATVSKKVNPFKVADGEYAVTSGEWTDGLPAILTVATTMSYNNEPENRILCGMGGLLTVIDGALLVVCVTLTDADEKEFGLDKLESMFLSNESPHVFCSIQQLI